MLPVNMWILSYLIQSPISKRKNIYQQVKNKKVRHSEQVQVVSNKKNPKSNYPTTRWFKVTFWFPKKVTKNCQPTGSLVRQQSIRQFSSPSFLHRNGNQKIVQVSLQKGSEHCPGTSSMSLPCERTVTWKQDTTSPRLGTWKLHPINKGRNPFNFGHERLEAQKNGGICVVDVLLFPLGVFSGSSR